MASTWGITAMLYLVREDRGMGRTVVTYKVCRFTILGRIFHGRTVYIYIFAGDTNQFSSFVLKFC